MTHDAHHVFGILATTHLPNGVHGEHGIANIHRGDAETRRGDGSDGASTCKVGAIHKLLTGHVRLSTVLLEARGGRVVGGISLLRVDLDHRARVDLGHMRGFMAIWIVWVNRMGHIR